jgi:hypothetical protein
MPVVTKLMKLSKLSKVSDEKAKPIFVVSIGKGLAPVPRFGSEVEYMQSLVNEILLNPEEIREGSSLLVTCTLQRHNFERFLVKPKEYKDSKEVYIPPDKINVSTFLEDREVVQLFKDFESDPLLATIGNDKDIDEEIAAKFFAAIFKSIAKKDGALYAKTMEPIWNQLNEFRLALFQNNKTSNKENFFYLKNRNGKIHYTAILPNGKEITHLTELESPSPFVLKNLLPFKKAILTVALEKCHITEEKPSKKRHPIQYWDQAIEECNEEADWESDGHPFRKYDEKLRQLEKDRQVEGEYRKAVEKGIEQVLKNKQFVEAGKRLIEIFNHSCYRQQIAHPILLKFIDAFKTLNFGNIGKISCRNYIVEEMAHSESVEENTHFYYTGKVISPLRKVYRDRGISLYQIKFDSAEPANKLVNSIFSSQSSLDLKLDKKIEQEPLKDEKFSIASNIQEKLPKGTEKKPTEEDMPLSTPVPLVKPRFYRPSSPLNSLRLFRSQKELQDRPSSPSEMKLVQELSNQMLLTLAKAMGSLVSINTEAGTESLHSVINDLMIEAQKVSSRLENKKKVFEHEPEIDSVSRSIRIYS